MAKYVLPLLMILFLASGCVKELSNSSVFGPGESEIAAAKVAHVSDFSETYNENRAKAESDYNGKWVKLRGILKEVREVEHFDGTRDFMLLLSDDLGKTDEIMGATVGYARKDEIMPLKVGQPVTVFGQIGTTRIRGVGGLPHVEKARVLEP